MKNPYEVSKQKLIYIFGIPYDDHRGLLKIGDTTITTAKKNLPPNCKELNQAAQKRINDYLGTANILYKLLHTELAVDNKNNSFRDTRVHKLLERFRVKMKGTTGKEWFRIDLKTAIAAIAAVKCGEKFLAGVSKKDFREEIIFRPEQESAINKTVKYFQTGDKFLWNAKMRFGKTLCALEVARQMNFAKTIIVTHRPIVNAGWYKDFNKIFNGTDYIFGSYKDKGYSLEELLARKKFFVYFISIQDLRSSATVGGKFNKNSAAFKTLWDFVIVDEAHEGTKTFLGDKVINALIKKETKFLALSGTPFNIIENYDAKAVYTWDYVMEQKAKADWDKNFPLDSNPYDELPRINIFTYNLGKLFNYIDAEEYSFSFREFFRAPEEKFIHEDDVKSFLDLLVKEDENNYPFAREDFRNMFRHTLWIIPGVKEGRALSSLLQSHAVFKFFKIVNVAGNGDSDDEPANALEKVREAIDNNERTITLSCGKLTAGVTVPEWTAVFYLAGGHSTSAANYLQTIFRVQSPCNKGGVSKRNCYVFDFAPDRALQVIADSVKVSTRAGKTTNDQRRALGELLNFCPVIAIEGSEMKNYNTADKILQKIKTFYAERVVRSGFSDSKIYNDELLKLNDLDLKKFDALKKIVGSSKSTNEISINEQGLTNEQRDKKAKTNRPKTSEEKELEKQKRRRLDAIKILYGISIRMPLLIYGANVDINEDITIEKFSDIVDDASWAEFMPTGVSKDLFAQFIKYYDPDVFVKAGRIVRERAEAADKLKPTDRVKKIAELFSTFKNPDKETVLTPWRVVNLHLSETFGGYNFLIEDEPPHFVPTKIFKPDKKILDINAKTGLYPLYVTYSIYRARLAEVDEDTVPLEELRRLWDKTVAENIFVICKTPMAKMITCRTLFGYRDGKNFNAHCFDDLINLLKFKPDKFVERVINKNFWNKGVGKMFFDGVVGNPPYQIAGSGDNKTFASPVYNLFMENAFKLSDKVSLIHPARCLFNAGATPQDFRNKILNDPHLKVIRYEPDSKKFFPTSDIKGGVAITYYDAKENFGAIGTFIPFDELKSIHQKVCVDNKNFRPLSEIMFGTDIYHWTEQIHIENPNIVARMSKGHEYDISTNAFELLPEIFLKDKPNDGKEYVQFFGREKNHRVYKWIRRDYLKEHKVFDKWKVFVPASNGSGAIGEVLVTPLVGSPLVGSPLVGHTSTFITVGAFDTRAEAEACIAYIKSKFCRVMLGILKVTQHNPPATWSKVPLEDFTSASDINWSGQVDEQLYRKYNLSAEEIKFIEEKVKAM